MPTQPGDEGERPAGALVRPYALVRGRTRVGDQAPLAIEAMVETVAAAVRPNDTLESQAIVSLASGSPVSVAELAVRLQVPLGVVRVLVAELRAAGAVEVHEPGRADPDSPQERALLERVLARLEAI